MRSGSHVVVIISGSIAAYKTAEIVRSLVKDNIKVSVVMTAAACEFITPLTMQTLTGREVLVDLFNEASEFHIGHIKVADDAEVVLVAPATANILAKAANGIADDAASSVLLATKAPVVMAPAMNVNMWEHPATQQNVAILRERGVHIVEPEDGELACGWLGSGRLASTERIMHALYCETSPKDLLGSRVIVAAGSTREPLDPVRFLGGTSSGSMGYAIAECAYRRGAIVSLVSGPSTEPVPFGVDFFSVVTAQEMRDQVFEILSERVETTPRMSADGKPQRTSEFVFMAASVSDFRPEAVAKTKLRNQENLSIKLVPNPDILYELGEHRTKENSPELKLVGFSASVGDPEELLTLAREKLDRKKADLIVGKFSSYVFGGDTKRVWLLDRSGRQEEISSSDNEFIADKIISAALRA